MSIGHHEAEIDKVALVDYWLSKLMFDLQAPANSATWRDSREAILDRYPLRSEIRNALLNDDIALLSRHVNAYLLRFHFAICGMSDREFIARLRAIRPSKETTHG
jgi:hypothetical protein